METVVRAADAGGAMRALVDRLGPQAVLLATRRLADGVEMTGAAAPPPADPAAAARFRLQAEALGFEAALIDAAIAAGPAARAADIWVRFVARIERRTSVVPPPHAEAPLIGVVGAEAARLALIEALATALRRERPLLVAAEGSAAAALGRRCRLTVVHPDLRWGIARLAPGRRLLLDLGAADDPRPLLGLIETQGAERGLVRLGAIGDDDPDPALAGRCEALALTGGGARPGAGISFHLAHGIPLAYVGAPLAAARASQLAQPIVAALARLGG